MGCNTVVIQILLLAEVIVVVEVLVVGLQIRPDEPTNIPSVPVFAVEEYHSPQSVCAKDDAPLNISSMFITLPTCHLDISLLNDDAETNIPIILVTLDTSHLEMSLLNDDAE